MIHLMASVKEHPEEQLHLILLNSSQQKERAKISEPLIGIIVT